MTNKFSKSFLKKEAVKAVRTHGITFVALIFALIASALATFFTYAFANESISDISSQLSFQVVEDIKGQIKGYLDQSLISTKPLALYLQNKEFDIRFGNTTDITKAYSYIYPCFVASNLTGLFVVDTYGADLGYIKSGGMDLGFFMFRNVTVEAGIYLIDSHGRFNWSHSEPISTLAGYSDATDWPPWVAARQSGGPLWAPPFLLGGVDDILFAHVLPIYYDDGELCCGLGLNIAISVWENLLASFNVTANAKVFVADSTGLLLADSIPGHVIAQAATSVETATLLSAEENSDALLAETARRVKQEYGRWEDVPFSNTQFNFDFESVTYLTLTSKLDYHESLRLVVVIVIPEDDFLGRIKEGRQVAIAITAVAAVLGAVKYIPYVWLYKYLRKMITGKSTSQVIEVKPEDPRVIVL